MNLKPPHSFQRSAGKESCFCLSQMSMTVHFRKTIALWDTDLLVDTFPGRTLRVAPSASSLRFLRRHQLIILRAPHTQWLLLFACAFMILVIIWQFNYGCVRVWFSKYPTWDFLFECVH